MEAKTMAEQLVERIESHDDSDVQAMWEEAINLFTYLETYDAESVGSWVPFTNADTALTEGLGILAGELDVPMAEMQAAFDLKVHGDLGE